MITRTEIGERAERFGVTAPQVARDHFVSHVLDALAALHPDVRFFGGTALCRTYLEGTRLSEDVLDVPAPQEMQCPSPATFAAMKLASWFDRHAPRDLSIWPGSRLSGFSLTLR